MSALIRIIFIVIGFAWGGLFGAIAGYFLADIFWILMARFGLLSTVYQGQSSEVRQVQTIFFRITFQVMGHVAKADGRVSENEIRAARFVMQRMGLNEHQKQSAIQYFSQGKLTSFNLETALTQLIHACQNNRVLLQMFVEIQFQAASAELNQSRAKSQLLQYICQRIGYTPFQFNFNDYMGGAASGYSHRQGGTYTKADAGAGFGGESGYYDPRQDHSGSGYGPFGSGSGAGAGYGTGSGYSSWYGNRQADAKSAALKNAYSVLHIKESASVKEIKIAYRKMMSQNHPDKLVAKGLPEEMIKLATEKTQNIQKAYELIRENRGF